MATFTHIIFVVGSLLLLHSGYSAVQHKSFLKLAEMYYNGLPLDITVECLFGSVLCCIAVLQGIPVSQQHLIYGTTELMDDLCLEEYQVRSGSQLKLVIAMRGGPIHAHRIQLEDSVFLELAEYLESQSPEDHEQYAAIFLTNEDNETRSQLHSPVEVSESRLRGGSQTSLVTTTNPSKVLSAFENDVTHSKMRELQSRLKNLRLNRTEALLSKPIKREKCSKLILHDSPSTIYPPPLTPSSSCACGCHKKCCQCSCHSVKSSTQRQLCFTPLQKRHAPSSREYKLRERHLSGRLRHDTRQSSCATSTDINDDLSWRGPKHQCSMKPIKHNEHGNLSHDRLHKNDHFLPPINFKASLKQTKPKKDNDCNYKLPPITPKRENPERNKCMKCQKRTRLANSYTCRCGGIYCSIHRYAETHSCTFNYKAEGKELIARNNPLVTAPKLSKI